MIFIKFDHTFNLQLIKDKYVILCYNKNKLFKYYLFQCIYLLIQTYKTYKKNT